MNITLTQGQYAVIDDEDFDKISAYIWRFNKSKMKTGYACTFVPLGRKGHKKGTRRKQVLLGMHNLITPPPSGLEVDHINGDGLDNRKINLRFATRSQQCMNRSAQHKSSQYKGVRLWKMRKIWQARIKTNGREIHLGYFHNEADAAKAYNAAAIEIFGEFAKLNAI